MDRNELKIKMDELKTLKRQMKEAEWEEKIKARNPQYVMGSLRQPTEADVEELHHCHGKVCEIECVTCGTHRVVNTQDAFQARYCKDCLRQARKLKGVSAEVLEARITELQELLTQKKVAG